MVWIWLSIASSLFFALRYLVIKLYLSDVDTYLMAFTYRFIGFIFLLPLLLFFELKMNNTFLFWKITITTSVFTAIASILQLKAIQKYELSSSIPFLAFVPLFMIIPVFFIYNELPNIYTIPGLLLLTLGGLVINGTTGKLFFQYYKELLNNKGSILILAVALIFGFTTTIDRKAILEANNSGFTYTFYWHIVSILLFSFIFFNFKNVPKYIKQLKHNILPFIFQGFFGISAFLCQMLAVENAKQVKANVIYVKAITLIYLILSVVFGIIIFKEKNARYKIAGVIIMLLGALFVMFNYN